MRIELRRIEQIEGVVIPSFPSRSKQFFLSLSSSNLNCKPQLSTKSFRDILSSICKFGLIRGKNISRNCSVEYMWIRNREKTTKYLFNYNSNDFKHCFLKCCCLCDVGEKCSHRLHY